MKISELVEKIHKVELENWSDFIITNKVSGKELVEKINKILSVTDTEQLIEWLVGYCGDDVEITLNYLLTYTIED